jgi:hypothetical protein
MQAAAHLYLRTLAHRMTLPRFCLHPAPAYGTFVVREGCGAAGGWSALSVNGNVLLN